MSIIKKTIRKMIVIISISVFLAILVISYMYYSKSKDIQAAFHTETYMKAFEQTKITSKLIETILENKKNITRQEVSSYLRDIQNSLDIVAKDFELISTRFLSNKPNINNNFMRDLIQLYSGEIVRLQSELSNNSSPDDFDNKKGILFTRMALMNSDLKKIIILDTPQLASYTYEKTSQAWVILVNTLEYREVTRTYKLKYPHLFTKGSVLPFKR